MGRKGEADPVVELAGLDLEPLSEPLFSCRAMRLQCAVKTGGQGRC